MKLPLMKQIMFLIEKNQIPENFLIEKTIQTMKDLDKIIHEYALLMKEESAYSSNDKVERWSDGASNEEMVKNGHTLIFKDYMGLDESMRPHREVADKLKKLLLYFGGEFICSQPNVLVDDAIRPVSKDLSFLKDIWDSEDRLREIKSCLHTDFIAKLLVEAITIIEKEMEKLQLTIDDFYHDEQGCVKVMSQLSIVEANIYCIERAWNADFLERALTFCKARNEFEISLVSQSYDGIESNQEEESDEKYFHAYNILDIEEGYTFIRPNMNTILGL